MRKAILVDLVLTLCVLAAGCGDAPAAGLKGIFGRESVSGAEVLPVDGAVPGLFRLGKPVSYSERNFGKYYGAMGNRFVQYGIQKLIVCEYALGDKEHRVTIEVANMDTPTAAAGIFHFHRANVAARAQPVSVGAEAVVDIGRESRNLYFYRAANFVKIIYSGPEPVPDLTPIAQAVDAKFPKNKDANPEGFEYIKVPGVAVQTVQLTPGFTFNISMLPPSVWASAPGGGSVASDLFVITRRTEKEAEGLVKDYFAYLKFNAEYFEEYTKDRVKFVKAVDPNQGRVVFASYRNVMIIAARPDGYEKGEALIRAVMARIDEVAPAERRRR